MDDFLSIVETRISKLTFKQQVLYLALTCEKLLPNYVEFYRRTNRGDLEVLEEAMMVMYQYLQDLPLNENELENIYYRVVEAIPESTYFKTAVTSFAIDTVTAFADAIEYLLSHEAGYVSSAAYCALKTVDRFAKLFAFSDTDDTYTGSHLYRKREIQRQTLLLSELQAAAELDLSFIAWMRELNSASGPIIDLARIVV